MIQVILVDRQPLIHEGIARVLAATSDIKLIYSLIDLNELHQVCQRNRPDVILLDAGAADQNRLVFTFDRIGRLHPKPFVIGLISTTHEVDLRGLLGLEINGVVSKTDDPQKLIDAIRFVVQGKSWFSASLYSTLARLSHQDSPELTKREAEMLSLIAQELTDKEIAVQLGISPRTVRFHLESLYTKLGSASRTGAVAEAIRRGLI